MSRRGSEGAYLGVVGKWGVVVMVEYGGDSEVAYGGVGVELVVIVM